jgi:hypothetical protein
MAQVIEVSLTVAGFLAIAEPASAQVYIQGGVLEQLGQRSNVFLCLVA